MGDRGRVVVPADVRERSGLAAGSRLVLIETPAAIVLMTQAQARARVRQELQGLDLLGDLLAERRREAANEDANVSVVLDASALLAFLQDEPGAREVEEALDRGAVCGAANWSEVAQRVLAGGRDWGLVRGLLVSYDLGVEPVSVADAEWAARRWRRGEGLSLADRLCLALAEREDDIVLTADGAWGDTGRVRQIRRGGPRGQPGP